MEGSSRAKNLPRIVSVRTMFFMILSHRLLHGLSGVSTLGSRWLSSILTSTCFCILLALKERKKKEELILMTYRLQLDQFFYYVKLCLDAVENTQTLLKEVSK